MIIPKSNKQNSHIILPQWDAPDTIKSLLTTRQGGCSNAPFYSFNLAEHVGDNSRDVKENRLKLAEFLPSEAFWLNQVHSNTIVDAGVAEIGTDADGSYSTRSKVVCVVMSADCLPVLICNRQGTGVAAIHAGWRGLVNGIVEQGVKKLLDASQCRPEDILVWLGPAIGSQKFEVGNEVRQAFLKKSPEKDKKSIEQCFSPLKKSNKYLADIVQLARLRLLRQGVKNISGGDYCTYTQEDKFFSYRRDGKTGRMASLIWIA